MRKIIAVNRITLDGVYQSSSAPTEDSSGGFKYGGWMVSFSDDVLRKSFREQMSRPFDLLLGRKTYDNFASYWPHHPEEGPGINNATKYVASNTLKSHEWEKSVFLSGDVAEEIMLTARQRNLLKPYRKHLCTLAVISHSPWIS